MIDTPITEARLCGGLVLARPSTGLRIVEFMTFNFAMQAIDHIVNSAAKTLYMSGGQMSCPIVFRGPNGAGGARGRPAQPGIFEHWYAHVPGLKVVAPFDRGRREGPAQSRHPRSRTRSCSWRTRFLYGIVGAVPKLGDFVSPHRQGRGLARVGKDVTIVSWSRGMVYALDAAKQLAEEGIEAEVIDLRTLRPLDIETVLASVRKTNRIVTVEEAWPVCSLGSEICAQSGGRYLRLSGRAANEGDGRGRAHALCRQSRKAGAARCRSRRSRRQICTLQELAAYMLAGSS